MSKRVRKAMEWVGPRGVAKALLAGLDDEIEDRFAGARGLGDLDVVRRLARLLHGVLQLLDPREEAIALVH